MPKLLVEKISWKEREKLNNKVEKYLKKNNFTILDLTNLLQMNYSTFQNKRRGIISMRKTEYDKIMKVIT